MDLYCWPHNTVHSFTSDEVELVVYALTATLADQEKAAPVQDPNDYPTLTCPKAMLELAYDTEAYSEHAEQGVACRKALT